MAKRRIAVEDLDIPDHAHRVEHGYWTSIFVDSPSEMQIHIYSPIMPSPRPRVTRRGTFMPSDYRAHCDRLACSLAYSRGWYQGTLNQDWPSNRKMKVAMTFFSPSPSGDCDNLAKTILDAGQLHRGEQLGDELWLNDNQIMDLHVVKAPSGEDTFYMTMLRISVLEDN